MYFMYKKQQCTPIIHRPQCTVVLVGVVFKVHLVAVLFDGCIKSIQVVVFSKATIITIIGAIVLCTSLIMHYMHKFTSHSSRGSLQ